MSSARIFKKQDTLWCDCPYHVGKNTNRLVHSRIRRVRSEMRRVHRRKYRQSSLTRWLFKEFDKRFQIELNAAVEREFSWPDIVSKQFVSVPDTMWDFLQEAFPLKEMQSPTDWMAKPEKEFDESKDLLGGDLALSLLQETRARRIEKSMNYGKSSTPSAESTG